MKLLSALLTSILSLGFVVTVLILSSCFPMLHEISAGQPDGALKYGSGPVPVNPDMYRVRVEDYPIYQVNSIRKPPTHSFMDNGILRTFDAPVGPILPGDHWVVRYKFRDYLMVNSLEFDQRQCDDMKKRGWGVRPRADGSCNYDWCLYIATSGTVTGGWDTCTLGGNKIVFKPDPDAVRLQDWGPQPFFQVVERPRAK
ncbi:MAG: hypothetical protein ABI831_02435 [Betaproteobacteria bacterium]